jgi:ubiquinone/menaquinone biosynthesis C-methylase UbiE
MASARSKTKGTPLWLSIDEVAEAAQSGYSVDKSAILKQYMRQVSQYPLYKEWFRCIKEIVRTKEGTKIIEYGSGPGVLAGSLARLGNISQYTAVEPESTFRQMTKEVNTKIKVRNSTAESYVKPESVDFVIATAAYHHFDNKEIALLNMFRNLQRGGTIIIADVFLPNYSFNSNYQPTNHSQFLNSVVDYTSAQIHAMPDPRPADIGDQIRTAILDLLRREELKVCLPILLSQMKKAGFRNIKPELMVGNNTRINYEKLGWYFVTASKM